MTARVDITDVEIRTDFKELLDLIIETGYSRLPVYDTTEDDIKGIIYSKDLLPYIGQDASFNWRKLMRRAYFVPETKMIDDLLEEFRDVKIHMAIVVDEFGGTSGIVTMEDILEEIVGDISDEYDEEEKNYVKLDDIHLDLRGKNRAERLLQDYGTRRKRVRRQGRRCRNSGRPDTRHQGGFPQGERAD